MGKAEEMEVTREEEAFVSEEEEGRTQSSGDLRMQPRVESPE